MLERSLCAQEQYIRRECLEIVGIPVSIDDKNLQATVCNILNEIDVPCGSEDLEDCHRIKGDRTMSSLAAEENHLRFCVKRKNLKILMVLNLQRIYRVLWGKCKKLWLDKVIFSFYTISGITCIKKSEQDSAIPITQDEDLWQFQVAEYLIVLPCVI